MDDISGLNMSDEDCIADVEKDLQKAQLELENALEENKVLTAQTISYGKELSHLREWSYKSATVLGGVIAICRHVESEDVPEAISTLFSITRLAIELNDNVPAFFHAKLREELENSYECGDINKEEYEAILASISDNDKTVH